MKTNKMNISYSTTVQMRQFEPVTIFVSAEVQIDPSDTPEQVFRKTYKMLSTEAEAQAKVLKVKRKESIDEEYEKAA